MRMTKKVFERIVERYVTEYDVNPLQKTRQRNVLVPRQTLFYILNTKFHIHFQTLSDWTGWDRSIGYHSVEQVNNGLDIKSAEYTDEINKWALVFTALDGIIKVKAQIKEDEAVSAEASIIKFLTKFDTTTSLDILYNVVNTLRNDR